MSNTVTPLRILPADIEPAAAPRPSDRERGFGDVLQAAIGEVDQLHQGAEENVAAVLAGKGAEVHSAMIAVEKADLSFQLMLQVRNKVVAAYQEIARLQF
ncbi:MAG TPA: flagellar hook-basal body complex protein FliE [Terriglobales bacterium]|nr:flagellar hook-basal body complex protein FliE [Terriglobales bacterium]